MLLNCRTVSKFNFTVSVTINLQSSVLSSLEARVATYRIFKQSLINSQPVNY